MSCVSIIIPAYNEKESLTLLIKELSDKFKEFEIIVVDDASDDGTAEIATIAGVKTVNHPYNMGNGSSIKSGIRAAKGDVLVFMDGDGQHDPADIDKLLAKVDHFTMVVGAREKSQQASKARLVMNYIYNKLASYVTGYPILDLTSGYRAMRAATAIDLLPFLPNGYSWPTTSTLVLLRTGLSIAYVPINARKRLHGCSRIRPVRDSIRFLLIIMKICTLYSPFRIFLPVSLAMFSLGLLNYLHTFFTEGRFTNMSALLFSSSVIIFMMGLISEQISQTSLVRHQIRPADNASVQEDKTKKHYKSADPF